MRPIDLYKKLVSYRIAVGRGVGLDWVESVDTSPFVEVLAPVAPPLSLAGLLVSRSSDSFTVGCTIRTCRCRLFVEPALYDILVWQILNCASTLFKSLKWFQMLLCFRLIFCVCFQRCFSSHPSFDNSCVSWLTWLSSPSCLIGWHCV